MRYGRSSASDAYRAATIYHNRRSSIHVDRNVSIMKKLQFLSLLLAVAALVSACAAAPTPQPASVSPTTANGPVTPITAEQLDQMLAGPKDFILVNVHVPYAGELARIVLYCRSGRMSDIAARRLAELGYTHIYDLMGGMVAWEASGRSLVQR
jgi:phage shock protein E